MGERKNAAWQGLEKLQSIGLVSGITANSGFPRQSLPYQSFQSASIAVSLVSVTPIWWILEMKSILRPHTWESMQ